MSRWLALGGWGWRSRTRVWCCLLKPEVFLEGRAAEPQAAHDPEGAEGLVPKGLKIPGGHRGGFWGPLGVRGADLGTPVQAWE